MKVFFMMSGQMTPHSIGLTDEKSIKDILMKTRFAFKCSHLFRYSVFLMGFMATFASYLLLELSLKTVIIGCLHSIIFSLGAQYLINIMCTQITYFYIICYYLKLKQREVNNYLRKVIKNKKRFKIFNSNQMIVKLNKIYEEIKECDSIFWSKFLALVWVLFTSAEALIIFIFSFSGKTTIFIKFILFYVFILFSFILLLVIEMSSSVNFEAKVTYKLLSSYKMVCIQTKQSVLLMARHGIKVYLFF